MCVLFGYGRDYSMSSPLTFHSFESSSNHCSRLNGLGEKPAKNIKEDTVMIRQIVIKSVFGDFWDMWTYLSDPRLR